MKRPTFLTWIFSLVAAVTLMTGDAKSQTVYGVDGGFTSLTISKDFLDSVGLNISSFTSDVATPKPGYDHAFAIIKDSDFCFTLDAGFNPVGGTIDHSGSFGFNGGTLSIGGLELGYDGTRKNADKSGFFITDTIAAADGGTGSVLFDLSFPSEIIANDSRLSILGSNLLVAPELADALGAPALSMTDAGIIRVDADVITKSGAVPEPSSALLLLFGGSLLLVRRKRGSNN